MAKASFDLASLDTVQACNKPAEIEIRHPTTGAPTGVFVSVLGRDSDVYRGIIDKMAQDALRKRAMGRTDDTSLEAAQRKNIEALAQVTTGWRTGEEPVVIVKGERLEYSEANAVKLYDTLKFVREQVLDGVNNLANFIPA